MLPRAFPDRFQVSVSEICIIRQPDPQIAMTFPITQVVVVMSPDRKDRLVVSRRRSGRAGVLDRWGKLFFFFRTGAFRRQRSLATAVSVQNLIRQGTSLVVVVIIIFSSSDSA